MVFGIYIQIYIVILIYIHNHLEVDRIWDFTHIPNFVKMFDSSIFNLLQKDYKSFVNVDFNGIIPLKMEDFPLPTCIN